MRVFSGERAFQIEERAGPKDMKGILGKVLDIAGRRYGYKEVKRDCAIKDEIRGVVKASDNVGGPYGPLHGIENHCMVWSHEVT